MLVQNGKAGLVAGSMAAWEAHVNPRTRKKIEREEMEAGEGEVGMQHRYGEEQVKPQHAMSVCSVRSRSSPSIYIYR